jgi:hypothetical protein
MMTASRPIFSGHETFQCRHLWLKKGYDYVKSGKSFSAEDAVVELGVGKNMVNSIRYWMRAFNVLEGNDQLTEFADRMFDDDGFDPYLEDDASLWLLHYQLVRKGYATTYSLIFNELRKAHIEFSKDNFVRFLSLKSKDENGKSFVFTKNTAESDFDVFVKLYVGTAEASKDKEEVVAGILPDLHLVRVLQREKSPMYHIEANEKQELPEEIILFALLSDEGIGVSINLETLERGYNSVGSIFAINKSGLVDKIERLCEKHDWLVYKDDAGIRELQFKSKPDAYQILEDYYYGR